jgi:hypothetical protein
MFWLLKLRDENINLETFRKDSSHILAADYHFITEVWETS